MYKKIKLILTVFAISLSVMSCEKAIDTLDKNDSTTIINTEKRGIAGPRVLGILGSQCTTKITYFNCQSTAIYGFSFASITVSLDDQTFNHYGPEFNYKVYSEGNVVLNLDLCGQDVILFKGPTGFIESTYYQVIITSQSGISNAIANDPNSDPAYPFSSYVTTTTCSKPG